MLRPESNGYMLLVDGYYDDGSREVRNSHPEHAARPLTVA